MQYDWDKIIEVSCELAGEYSQWTDLKEAINSRLDISVGERTFPRGIRRELERDFPTYKSFRNFALGGEGELSPLAQSLLDYLRVRGRERTFSLIELCNRFDRGPQSILSASESLRESNYNVLITDDRAQISMPSEVAPTGESIPLWPWADGQIYRFGIISDTHLANRNARLDVLNTLYDMFEKEGIEVVLLAGNLIDGEFKYNRQELLVTGVEGQIAFAAENFPQREGITTKFITANDHEGWWTKDIGFDIGRHMDHTFNDLGREDLEWIGHVEADMPLHKDNPQAVLRISHPTGGSAYATSYKAQKFVESLQGGEKPSIWIIGHFHKYISFYPRGVYILQPGCVEDQTLYLRTKHIPCHVGGCILEVKMTTYGGVGRVDHRWIPFYDRSYYNDWDYQSMHV